MHAGCLLLLLLVSLIGAEVHAFGGAVVLSAPSTRVGKYRGLVTVQAKGKSKGKGKGKMSPSKKNKKETGGGLAKLVAGFAGVVLALGAFFGGSNSPEGGSGGGSQGMFLTARDIPKEFYREKSSLYGQVVKVVDGDTLRLRHLPGALSSAAFDGNLKDQTIMVRIAAVDSPETAKFGQVGQPFGDVAKEFATNQVLNKKVRVKALAKDRYERLLGVVWYQDGVLGGEKDLSEELLKQGLAVVYTGGGAQYDGRRSEYERLEDTARRSKKGLWSQKDADRESPAEYKKKVAAKANKQSKSKTRKSRQFVE